MKFQARIGALASAIVRFQVLIRGASQIAILVMTTFDKRGDLGRSSVDGDLSYFVESRGEWYKLDSQLSDTISLTYNCQMLCTAGT